MIGNLSSFIELLAAIYLTVVLDDLLFKRFWTPDYEQELKVALDKIDLPTIAKTEIFKRAKLISNLEDRRSRKRGGIIFFFAMLMLVFIGFENFNFFRNTNLESVLISIFAVIVLLVYIFDSCFLKNVIWVAGLLLISPILVFICYIATANIIIIDRLSHYFISWEIAANIIVVVLLVSPIVWQLFRNWMYTRFYLQYIIYIANQKAEEYNYAINYDHAKGSKMDLVAPPYVNHVAESIASHEQDRAITPFIRVLKQELFAINYVPNIYDLVKSSVHIWRKHNPSKTKLKRLCREYERMKHKPNLEMYCKQNNIDVNILKKYRNIYL